VNQGHRSLVAERSINRWRFISAIVACWIEINVGAANLSCLSNPTSSSNRLPNEGARTNGILSAPCLFGRVPRTRATGIASLPTEMERGRLRP
jgi:hypothetical protein